MNYDLKPVLILNCSGGKKKGARRAAELYTGTLFSMLPEKVLEKYDLLILSAQFGLLNGHDIIDSYDKTLPKAKTQQWHDFVSQSQSAATQTLRRLDLSNRHVFVIATNAYLQVLDHWCLDEKFHTELNRAASLYISRKHRGIGVLKGRLSAVLKSQTPEIALSKLQHI